MKDSGSSVDNKQGLEGYVNHGLSGSTNNVDLIHSFHSLHNSHGNHREIQGSSDFICKFETMMQKVGAKSYFSLSCTQSGHAKKEC